MSGRATVDRRDPERLLVSKIMHLSSFAAAWETFVTHIRDALLLDGRAVNAPALRCLERALNAAVMAMLSTDAEEGLSPSFRDLFKDMG